ncbi:hypothetical protein ACFW0U_14025 [Streptomyces albidoflavus]
MAGTASPTLPGTLISIEQARDCRSVWQDVSIVRLAMQKARAAGPASARWSTRLPPLGHQCPDDHGDQECPRGAVRGRRRWPRVAVRAANPEAMMGVRRCAGRRADSAAL